MRRWAFLLLLAGLAWPARAATGVSVAYVDQLLAKTHKLPDKKVAHKIDGLELTERVSYARLARWKAMFPGPESQGALIKLADAAAFLSPAVNDIPDRPKPDREEQKQILMKALDYTVDTLHRLPNFTATRRTRSFEGQAPSPADKTIMGLILGPREADDTASANNGDDDFRRLTAVESWNQTVTYRDGAEVVENGQALTAEAPIGLASSGEFGPILNVVLSDAMQGKLLWDHWERGANGDFGVFSYTVPQEHSHYRVGRRGFLETEGHFPAYHGEIGIDPATGSILRISMDADFGPNSAAKVSSIQVEYGSVKIGGSSYICPLWSVVRYKSAAAVEESGTISITTHKTYATNVNDVVFTDYHLFRSESRILPVVDTSGNSGAPAATPVQAPTPEPK